MRTVNEIGREEWLHEMFPEWGNWLLEDIEDTVVQPGTFAAWWLGCTGIWMKSEGGTNIAVDLFSGRGKSTHKCGEFGQGKDFQLNRIAGGYDFMPNPRNIPFLLDPFSVRQVDALLATHNHNDHMDIYTAAAFSKLPDVQFIGPKAATDKWRGWGVPEDRLITVRPGDKVNIGDMEILALDSFDKTALVTAPPEGSIVGIIPEMDERSANYLITTPGGTFYHSGDSHFSNYSLRHGKQHKIDVAIAPFAENPPGVSDKMTSSDVLRFAENLRCKVIIPVHYDIWCNFLASPDEIELLYNFKKDRLDYQFNLFIWQIGGKNVFPDDQYKRRYMYPRGFKDAMEHEPNIPFKSFL